MTHRIIAVAIIGVAFATSALAQVGGGGAASAGPGSGAPGTTPSGTAGVNSSTATPAPGPGVPGAASGAGLPGGPGPGNQVVVPSNPAAPPSGGTGGSSALPAGTSGSPSTLSGGGSRLPAGNGSRITAIASAPDQSHPDFHPEAVTTRGLDVASEDIAAMPIDELRALVALLDACTVDGHPAERTGKCGAANRSYKAAYAKERQIDRTLAELDRVVRFQNMFKATGPATTEYEDQINARLRSAAKTSLVAANAANARQGLPLTTRDASMPR